MRGFGRKIGVQWGCDSIFIFSLSFGGGERERRVCFSSRVPVLVPLNIKFWLLELQGILRSIPNFVYWV